MPKFTNKGLMAYARCMCDYNSPYWYGVKGFICSEVLFRQKQAQYPSQYPPVKWTEESFRKQFGKKGHDCSGLPEGYLMSPCIDANGICTDPLKPSVYNSKYDWSANTMIERCKEKGDISTMPEIEGLVLWKEGHVALYDGKDSNGVRWCIEAKGHAYGTVRSKVSERGFKKWGKIPEVEYITDDPAPSPSPAPSGSISMPTLKKGDKKDEVTLFQMCMNDLGYKDQDRKALVIDGSMGSRSIYVLNLFKADNGLPVNSICDDATWQKILHKRYK